MKPVPPLASCVHLVALLALCALSACAMGSGPDVTHDMQQQSICPGNPQFCPSGVCCGTSCADTKVDARNCGGCDIQCETGTVCANGKCGCLPTGVACGTGQSCCGNSGCKSTASDINNCGACGKACGAGSTCEAGVCKCGGVACSATQVCCNGACAATCNTAPDMAAGKCVCAGGCPITNICVGPNCCFEDVLIGGSCNPDPSCIQSSP